MNDSVKRTIERPAARGKDAVRASCESPADRHWFQDALEDDEVREVLGIRATFAPCSEGGETRTKGGK
ncbi:MULTISPECIES: hypothetical protein [unclassified Bradyrhizobium]|jgi:hypothetical protein|uniref:hypothetical protein n=1 Tax=unclassified Bradyrhizobium TaxID=2631580 RepID=UPI0011AEAD8A|nr:MULTISPECIES: hypothetical protein [unclassified Bradyrhizobium]